MLRSAGLIVVIIFIIVDMKKTTIHTIRYKTIERSIKSSYLLVAVAVLMSILALFILIGTIIFGLNIGDGSDVKVVLIDCPLFLAASLLSIVSLKKRIRILNELQTHFTVDSIVYCKSCGCSNLADTHFCTNCGAEIQTEKTQ